MSTHSIHPNRKTYNLYTISVSEKHFSIFFYKFISSIFKYFVKKKCWHIFDDVFNPIFQFSQRLVQSFSEDEHYLFGSYAMLIYYSSQTRVNHRIFIACAYVGLASRRLQLFSLFYVNAFTHTHIPYTYARVLRV